MHGTGAAGRRERTNYDDYDVSCDQHPRLLRRRRRLLRDGAAVPLPLGSGIHRSKALHAPVSWPHRTAWPLRGGCASPTRGPRWHPRPRPSRTWCGPQRRLQCLWPLRRRASAFSPSWWWVQPARPAWALACRRGGRGLHPRFHQSGKKSGTSRGKVRGPGPGRARAPLLFGSSQLPSPIPLMALAAIRRIWRGDAFAA